jgi:hypothetical protein
VLLRYQSEFPISRPSSHAHAPKASLSCCARGRRPSGVEAALGAELRAGVVRQLNGSPHGEGGGSFESSVVGQKKFFVGKTAIVPYP